MCINVKHFICSQLKMSSCTRIIILMMMTMKCQRIPDTKFVTIFSSSWCQHHDWCCVTLSHFHSCKLVITIQCVMRSPTYSWDSKSSGINCLRFILCFRFVYVMNLHIWLLFNTMKKNFFFFFYDVLTHFYLSRNSRIEYVCWDATKYIK